MKAILVAGVIGAMAPAISSAQGPRVAIADGQIEGKVASILTDFGFTHNAQVLATRQAANNGGAVWMYRVDWQTPVLGGILRSPHGIELPFLFDALGTSPELVGATPPKAMAYDLVHLVTNPDLAIRVLWDGITGEAATRPAASQ